MLYSSAWPLWFPPPPSLTPPIQVKKRLCHRGWLRSPCPLGWPASRKTPLPRLCPAPASSQTRRFEDVLICTLSPPIGWSHSVHGGLHFPWAPNFKASMGPGPFSRYPHEWSLEFSQSLTKTSPWPRSGCRLEHTSWHEGRSWEGRHQLGDLDGAVTGPARNSRQEWPGNTSSDPADTGVIASWC